MKRKTVLIGLGVLVIFFAYSTSYASALIFGEVKSDNGVLLNNVNVRILNSGYKTNSNQNGIFKLPFSPGNFTIVFEKLGYVPRAYKLSLSTKDKYPLGNVSLKKFPKFYDVFESQIENVKIIVKQKNRGETLTVDHRITDDNGDFILQYYSSYMIIEAKKEYYRPQIIELDLVNYEKPLPSKIILPPLSPGLFYEKKAIPTNRFDFEKKKMVGLMIPAYYDGSYTAVGTPFLLTSTKQDFVFFWMPKTDVTFGTNQFASKGGLFVLKVMGNGNFVFYDYGVSEGQKIAFEIEPIYNKTAYYSDGLVQQEIQVYKVKINLPIGEYFLFEGGGNSMDREPHPDKDLNSWYFYVGTEEEIKKKRLSY